MKKVLFYNVLFLFLGVLVLELSFGYWLTGSKIAMVQVIRDTHQVFHLLNEKGERQEETHYIRDRWGFRGKYPSPNKIHVLTLGGSTTDQRYINEGNTWQDVMASCLTQKKSSPVYVVNAGVDGHSAYGHLESFDIWFPQIPDLKPQYVLVYTGLNDWASLNKGELPHIGIKYRFGVSDLIVKKSALYRLYSLAQGIVKAKDSNITHWQLPVSETVVEVKSIKEIESELERNPNFFLNEDTTNANLFEHYKNRLIKLAGHINALGAQPIFVSQRRMYYRINGSNVESLAPNGIYEYKLWKKMASVASEVCKETGAQCIDLQAELQLEPEDFYDPTHNSSKGTRKIGEYLCEKLQGLPFRVGQQMSKNRAR